MGADGSRNRGDTHTEAETVEARLAFMISSRSRPSRSATERESLAPLPAPPRPDERDLMISNGIPLAESREGRY